MISPFSKSSSDHDENQPRPRLPKLARLNSLSHQLQHAKDSDGQSLPLLEHLLVLLDDPPAGTTDRWQFGADLCRACGIRTSRMSVWRLYRAHLLRRRPRKISPHHTP